MTLIVILYSDKSIFVLKYIRISLQVQPNLVNTQIIGTNENLYIKQVHILSECHEFLFSGLPNNNYMDKRHLFDNI